MSFPDSVAVDKIEEVLLEVAIDDLGKEFGTDIEPGSKIFEAEIGIEVGFFLFHQEE